MLHLNGVDAKNQSDIEGWNAQGIPVGPLESLKQSPFYTAGISYRFDREYALSLTSLYWSKTVSSSYSGTDATLQVDRGVSSTDIALGILYYPANQSSFFEWDIRTNIGLTMARATSKAAGSSLKKIGGVITLAPFVDTDATYKTNKLTVSITAGLDRQLVSNLHLKVEAGYRFAQMGTMDGDVTSFGVHTTETSTTVFDYSGILISAGLAFEI